MGSSSVIGAALGALAIGASAYLLGGASNDVANGDKAMEQARAAMIQAMQPKRQQLANNLERQVSELGGCHEYDAINTYACQRPKYLSKMDEQIKFWRADEPLRKRYYQLWPYGSLQYVLQLNPTDKGYVHLEVKHAPYTFEYDGNKDRLSYFSNEDATRRPVDQAFFRNMVVSYHVAVSLDSRVHGFLGLEDFPPLMQRITTKLLATAGNNIDLNRCRRQSERTLLKSTAGAWEITCTHQKSANGADGLWLWVATRDYSAAAPVPFLN